MPRAFGRAAKPAVKALAQARPTQTWARTIGAAAKRGRRGNEEAEAKVGPNWERGQRDPEGDKAVLALGTPSAHPAERQRPGGSTVVISIPCQRLVVQRLPWLP
jgi:hypothetical protein